MPERTQQQYQVRFAWGTAGAERIAHGTHLLVWVDVLPGTHDHGRHDHDQALRRAVAALPDGPEVVLGHLGNATAIAERVTRLQADRGDRCVVAIVAAGADHDAHSDAADAAGEAWDAPGSPDFAVEDLLGAGAVVDALAAVGIDHTSPEAAAACAAATGLRRAVRHLVSASEGARRLDPATVRAALERGGELVTLRA
ncbi:hypothetical protein Csp2054_17410 [Curtobacterium sp. 'Ferrero']|uniref:2-phosphosulfolactate phosphatase n=1 Tax=Curtobacterium sp. 'Ferrero' TaxID=2033654 RepID=UPI000BCE92A5|nr:2-phosphosulfolactate phosphatase [Curtobacterium sp. 'Ferrero']PCN46416.1 hypothetical protein Csp2054_17410 [Curtobacterium sp. 'Ferrero']